MQKYSIHFYAAIAFWLIALACILGALGVLPWAIVEGTSGVVAGLVVAAAFAAFGYFVFWPKRYRAQIPRDTRLR